MISKKTMSVEAAGKKLGLGRNATYAAVHRGEIPVIKIGVQLLVPIAALERLLEGDWRPRKEAAGGRAVRGAP